ncbi:MAG TPA: hypothetical protein GXX73_00790 [Clostridium sp.]|nr:hypothetical protein A7W90_08255 [Clostridium sp. Bc-iso-3]HHV28144.1 hypothetical protein [Clostridium sp.]
MIINKLVQLAVVVINIFGVLCLIYFAIPYVTHNTVVQNPDAMLPAEAWDAAGMTLTIGLIPLVIANVLGFVFVKNKKKLARLLWFIPSIACLVMVVSYWIGSI